MSGTGCQHAVAAGHVATKCLSNAADVHNDTRALLGGVAGAPQPHGGGTRAKNPGANRNGTPNAFLPRADQKDLGFTAD